VRTQLKKWERIREKERRRAAYITQQLTNAWIDVHVGKKVFPYLEHGIFRPANADQPDFSAFRAAVTDRLTREKYANKRHEYWIEPGDRNDLCAH
jgi:hypothetical protein